MPFLATMPITMIIPMNDEMLKVVRVTSKAIKTPEVESKAEERMATGAANVPNSNSSTMNSSRIARISTIDQVVERALLFLVSSAVFHADAGRDVQAGDYFLHVGHAAAQASALQTGGHGHVALQVFAPNLGLPGILDHRCERAQRCRVSGAADQQGVAHGFERSSVRRWETHAQRVGPVVGYDRRGRRFTFQNGRGIERDFLGGESRPGGHARDRPEKSRRVR